MASIRKLPNGKYQATISFGRTKDNKQIREYITRDTWHECRDDANLLELQHNSVSGTMDNEYADSVIDKWWQLNESRFSPTTIRPYSLYIKRFKAYFGDYKMKKISRVAVEEFIVILRTGGKIKDIQINKQSNTSQRKQITVLKEIFQWAMKSKSPASEIKLPEKNKFIPNILSNDEFNELKEFVKSKRDELPILLAALCGLRLSEIFGLKWSDIDFKNNIIKIRRVMVKDKNGKWIIKNHPKSSSGMRDIICGEEIMNALENYQKSTSTISGHILRNDTPDAMSQRYKHILKALKLPDSRFHDLRHYRATRMLEAGIPDILASQQLGHSEVSTTKKIYQHITKDMVSAAKNKIRNLS